MSLSRQKKILDPNTVIMDQCFIQILASDFTVFRAKNHAEITILQVNFMKPIGFIRGKKLFSLQNEDYWGWFYKVAKVAPLRIIIWQCLTFFGTTFFLGVIMGVFHYTKLGGLGNRRPLALFLGLHHLAIFGDFCPNLHQLVDFERAFWQFLTPKIIKSLRRIYIQFLDPETDNLSDRTRRWGTEDKRLRLMISFTLKLWYFFQFSEKKVYSTKMSKSVKFILHILLM